MKMNHFCTFPLQILLLLTKKIACQPNDLFKYIYCPEGIPFREINEEKTKISFNLLDSSQSDYIDYFEIQVNSKKDVNQI
ncbi:MAG: hypothetical protein K6E78_07890 [Treponema sp.]|nr:hypothetical protein [Treponema sp.]